MNVTEADMIDFINEQSYITNEVHLRLFYNSWVSFDSVIYKNGFLIKETVPAKNYEGYYKFRYLFKNILVNKKEILDRSTPYLLVTDLWSPGHFHWFCDVIPRLLCIKDRTKDFVLLLPDTSYIRKIALESLGLLGIVFKNILLMKEGRFYKTKNLYFVSRVTASGRMDPQLMQKARELFGYKGPGGNQRIYISRNKARFRKVLNEQALSGILKQYGFEIIHTENLSLSEQMSLFSSASVLMGIHGAGLTNCVFMQPGSSVIELRKKENGASNVGYWHLADSLDQAYYYYNGIPDSDLPLVGPGCNLTIPPEDLEQKILLPLQKQI
jgi:hypothetical protein